ncbi:MAG: methyltransferase domain-containing protein [Verrucomicrobiota bacterium]
MDERTKQFYERDAAATAAKYRAVDQSAWRQQVQEAFPAGGRVLDVGTGSGRDLALLLEMGFDGYGTEPVGSMRQEALKAYPQIAGKLFDQPLPLPENADMGGTFDGIVCSAVLMHVPEAELFDAAFSLKRMLREKGRLWISVPATRPGLDAEDRDEAGRLFNPLHTEFLVLLFERLGFQLLRQTENSDRLGRDGIAWNSFLFELDSARGRPLEKIARVINQDTKDATYKLALLRALSEIGTKNTHLVEWVGANEVAVPMKLIAEKWLRYYWPLFQRADFIPQKNGERIDGPKSVAFRKGLTGLIDAYREGGLSRFLVDVSARKLTTDTAIQHRKVLARLADTIRDGPVQYASGEMFRYDKTRKAVLIKASAWREFSQLGQWIGPAVILQWAEETNRFSKKNISVATALDLLTDYPTEERMVDAAKKVYDDIPDKRCVWTDRPLGAGYEVDHVIPFSLWHCNDLWNLLPSDAKANNSKRDKLPERELLLRRKDAIVTCWETVRQRHERRFEYELINLTGDKPVTANWQNGAFQRLAEAVEVTAIQRGAKRWRPGE